MKRVFAVIVAIGILVNGCAIHSQYKPGQREYKFRFAKRLFFNTYHLKIINNSRRRSIGFYFYNGKNYCVLLKDGTRAPFDSKLFYYIGNKGAYYVGPGRAGSIPFEISKSAVRQAKMIVFQGQTYVSRREEGFLHRDNIRNIILVVDIAGRKITISEGSLKQALPTTDIEDYFSLGETLPDESIFEMKSGQKSQKEVEEILKKY